MISVLTPSIRPDRLAIVADSIQRQTIDDVEWLIGSPFDPKIPFARWIPDMFIGGIYTLNRMYNALIKEAHGDIIVSWQDSIYIPPAGLENFESALKGVPPLSIISGIGDQYIKQNLGRPTDKVWTDPRRNANVSNSFYECTFPDVEWNWCCTWKSILQDIGGFDEGMDFIGYGLDGYQVNERLNELGGHFYLDKVNESYTVRHDRSAHGGQENWDKYNMMTDGRYEKRRQDLLNHNQWPVVDNAHPIPLDTTQEVN